MAATNLSAVPLINVIWDRMVVMDSPDLAGTAPLSTQKPTQDNATRERLGKYIVTR